MVQQQSSRNRPERIGRLLLKENLIDEAILASALGAVHNMPTVNLDSVQVDRDAARILPHAICQKYLILPFHRGPSEITVAVADPVDVVALDEVKSRLQGLKVIPVVAPASQIQAEVSRIWGDAGQEDAVERFLDDLPKPTPELLEPTGSGGAVEIVNQILRTAGRRNASDVHIEPMSSQVRVRLRIDGVMQELLRLPSSSLTSIVTRLKILSGLSVMERRRP